MTDDTFRKVNFEEKRSEPVKNPAAARGSVKKNKGLLTALLVLVVVGAGAGTGFSLSQLYPMPGVAGKTATGGSAQTGVGGVSVGAVFGSRGASEFKDNAEGVLVAGGIEGEGSHHIMRVGGVSQNVYLTSSEVDLNQFVDAKIKVYGETFKAQKAGWLMDVGRVEVIELNAQKPFEEATTGEGGE